MVNNFWRTFLWSWYSDRYFDLFKSVYIVYSRAYKKKKIKQNIIWFQSLDCWSCWKSFLIVPVFNLWFFIFVLLCVCVWLSLSIWTRESNCKNNKLVTIPMVTWVFSIFYFCKKTEFVESWKLKSECFKNKDFFFWNEK